MRLGNKGKYRRIGKLYKLEDTTNYEPVFSENPVVFRYKISGGENMQKEEYKLFSNWIMQSSKTVVETNSMDSFEKGDRVNLDDGEYMIQRVIEKIDREQLNGRKKMLNKRVVLFCE